MSRPSRSLAIAEAERISENALALNARVQQAKELIALHADGSGTPVAELAKKLWYILDTAQKELGGH